MIDCWQLKNSDIKIMSGNKSPLKKLNMLLMMKGASPLATTLVLFLVSQKWASIFWQFFSFKTAKPTQRFQFAFCTKDLSFHDFHKLWSFSKLLVVVAGFLWRKLQQ